MSSPLLLRYNQFQNNLFLPITNIFYGVADEIETRILMKLGGSDKEYAVKLMMAVWGNTDLTAECAMNQIAELGISLTADEILQSSID